MIEAIEYALLLGEMEGVYSKLKQLGTEDEVTYINTMKKKYYKKYFSTLKEERKNS